jgi:hypothetical protein
MTQPSEDGERTVKNELKEEKKKIISQSETMSQSINR